MGLNVDLFKKVNGFTLDARWKIGREFAVLFGPSGAGKSLTLKMIAGLFRPDRGHVISAGNPYFDSNKNINMSPQKRHCGYVFQDLALFPHMTVRENILYGAKGLEPDEAEQRCSELARLFQIDNQQNKMSSEISGGQKQRAALARALIRRPEMLLLDEPFSALDTPLRLEMRAFLKDLRSEFNIPVVLVTHDFIEACDLADNIIIYSDGRVAQTGTPEEIIANPENGAIRKYLDQQVSNFAARNLLGNL
ncbi:MAG: ATP-binding cassette domain-containing protein [Dissulfurispiraceae bacterium]|jgi:molybdate transport system ATP-binding protein|nr:ATP-binding cassette domain-containing protein [Dissulfurispiraceae bacterium]